MEKEETGFYSLNMAELQTEYGPAVCQSGLRGCNRVSEVEVCQEAAAQRQVPQQRWASCPPAAYKNFFLLDSCAYGHDGSACNDSLTSVPVIKPGTTEGRTLWVYFMFYERRKNLRVGWIFSPFILTSCEVVPLLAEVMGEKTASGRGPA